MIYFDDGKWFLRTFDKERRTREQIEHNEVNINDILNIDSYTMANEEFPDPFGSCCFVDDKTIFLSVFHNYTRTHYHFIWDT